MDSYKYLKNLEISQQFVDDAVSVILIEVEKVCRYQNELDYSGSGFSHTFFHGFEGSLQNRIVKELEKLEYKCSMNFNKDGTNYLTIKGW